MWRAINYLDTFLICSNICIMHTLFIYMEIFQFLICLIHCILYVFAHIWFFITSISHMCMGMWTPATKLALVSGAAGTPRIKGPGSPFLFEAVGWQLASVSGRSPNSHLEDISPGYPPHVILYIFPHLFLVNQKIYLDGGMSLDEC